MIQGDEYKWSEKSIDSVKTDPAVYELYSNKVLIYIGSTGNLSQRFKGYWSSNFSQDSCKRVTDGYKRDYVITEQEARRKESANLWEFQNHHDRLPRCNDLIP